MADRIGLTTFAVSFRAGRIVPELAKGSNWPYEVIGIAFAVVGFGFVGYGYVRHRDVEHALDRGEYASLPDRVAVVFACAGALLGLATIVLLVLHPG